MQENEPNQNDRRNGGENGFNWKGLILLSVAMGLFGLAIWSRDGLSSSSKAITYAEFKKLVQDGKIHVDAASQPPKLLSLVQRDGSMKQYVSGWYEPEVAEQKGGLKYRQFTVPVILDYVGDEMKALLKEKNLEISDLPTDSDGIGMMLMSFYLPIFFLLILLYFLFRHQIKAAGKGAMSFGKSKAKLMTMDKGKVTFKDVAGVEEAKEEVWEIVEYLRDPKKFQRLGGRIPKGVLMVGSPGTGKTLLARAIAGEADVPFFSISGSDFVEMFVGVGASRVRDMFEQGKKNAPCLIFIDEIDAVGRHRGHGLGGGHDEREQTLNALLVEMDGFDTQEGVIIIAATNRPDVLDPALLRPGRFDREITVGLPDVNGREEILKVHAKKVKLAEGVDLGVVARGTPGYSGAELANVINEAALLAARKGLKAISLTELEEARDKVRWGKERRSLAISEKDKEKTAYHEAGHAILLVLLENTDPLHKVTIIPRGPSLGSTMWLPIADKYTQRKSELLDQLVVIMGGRVAEEVVFGDVASGASGDIKQATAIARKMVCEWGMSEELGMVEYGDHQEHVFLGRDMGSPRNYSESTAQKIDAEVKRLIDTAYAKATELIVSHRDKLDVIAKGLLEYETLDAKHIHEIMEHGGIQNPPSSPTPPDLPSDAPKKRPVEKEKESEGDFPGLPAPA
ncbi:MAG: cell division protein FtsH [Verrucomicrobiia bacterium Tous-C2TDCM]|nr:MAG: cell division protein FtsH [Verrucomicrobiae bacterium Tous-C2TDCM]